MWELTYKKGNSMAKQSFRTKRDAEVEARKNKWTIVHLHVSDKEHEDFDVHGMVKNTLKRSKKHADASKNIPETIPESMKTGGMVRATKPHLLHKGEMVIPKTVVSHLEKLLKKK